MKITILHWIAILMKQLLNRLGILHGGPVSRIVSNCPNCQGKINCEVLRMIRSKIDCLYYEHKSTWIALCDVFNIMISDSVKQMIKDHNESSYIRCLDAVHHVCHDNSGLTLETIKLKLESKYPYLANDVNP